MLPSIHWLEHMLNRKVGASTGTNVWGALQLAIQMPDRSQSGAIVTILCDSGERYLHAYYNPQWVSDCIGDLAPYLRQLENL